MWWMHINNYTWCYFSMMKRCYPSLITCIGYLIEKILNLFSLPKMSFWRLQTENIIHLTFCLWLLYTVVIVMLFYCWQCVWFLFFLIMIDRVLIGWMVTLIVWLIDDHGWDFIYIYIYIVIVCMASKGVDNVCLSFSVSLILFFLFCLVLHTHYVTMGKRWMLWLRKSFLNTFDFYTRDAIIKLNVLFVVVHFIIGHLLFFFFKNSK